MKGLDTGSIILLIFGTVLVLTMIGAIFYYFSSKRKAKIEGPKYDMLKDDEDAN